MHIIGIAGMSCSGKSTVAKLLAEKLNAELISLDDVYIKGSEKIFVEFEGEKVRTFERPELYDGPGLAKIIQQVKQGNTVEFEFREGQEESNTLKHVIRTLKPKKFYVLEGFLLFTYPQLVNLIDTKVFIDIPESVSLQRRVARNREVIEKIETYVKIGFQEWEIYGNKQKDIAQVLDGTRKTKELVEEILKEIK